MTSLRQRLIVGILAGITVILAANGLAIYLVVGARLRSEMDQALASVARSTANRVALELRRPVNEGRPPLLAGVDLPRPNGTGSAQETWDLLQELASTAASIRIRGMRAGGARAAGFVRLLGRRSACVAELTRDRAASRAEVDALIRAAREGNVDVAVLGEGAFAAGTWGLDELLRLADEVRERLPAAVELAVCEPREVWLTNPELVEAVDRLHVLYSPTLLGAAAEDAVRVVACWQHELRSVSGGRPVVAVGVGVGGPGTSGDAATPPAEDEVRFLAAFAAWARLNDAEYFHTTTDSGLLTPAGTIAPAVRGALEGALAAPGAPAIALAEVPPRGQEGDLVGAVRNVGVQSHRVVVYIRSGGAWWNKPSFAAPITSIRCDSTWTTDVTTGEGDVEADALVAFLVPAGFTPPFLEGAPELPQELFSVALDVAEVQR